MQQYTTAKIMRIARVVLLRTFQKIEFTQLFADSVPKKFDSDTYLHRTKKIRFSFKIS